jgi:prepilin-type N-terminal cleavage/methylation domain-containing protein
MPNLTQPGCLRGRLATRGFTLVELLVVLSIIALLIAVLMPALQSSLHTARAASCAANLKQVGVAIGTYCEANDGYYPAGGKRTGNEGLGLWYSVLGKYNNDPYQLLYYLAPYLSDVDAGTYSTSSKPVYSKVLTCPGNQRNGPWRKDNVQFLLGQAVWGYPGLDGPQRRSEVIAGRWLLSDVDKTHPSISPAWGNYGLFADVPAHQKVWNILYMDFSVETTRRVP